MPCKDDYVGESARSASTRNSEHFSTSQSAPGLYKSAIMQHAADANHHFRSSDIKVISRGSGWHERGVRESIYIRAFSPTLNRNEGCHALPHCYDSLIKKTFKKPPPPEPHKNMEPLLSTTKRPPGRPRASENNQQTAAKTILSMPEQTLAKTIVPTHNMVTRSRTTRNYGSQGPP